MSILERVVINERIETIPPMRWLLEGQAKTGKSTAALSWPKPLFLDMPDERGLAFLEGLARLPIEKFADIRVAFNELRDGKHGYETVVIDTLNAMYSMCVRENFGDSQMQQRDYPHVYAQIMAALDAFSSLGLHVVLVSHVKPLFDKIKTKGKNGKSQEERILSKYVNALPGQLSERVAAMADHVLHTGVSEDGEFSVICRAIKMYEAGGRLSELPRYVMVPEGEPLYPLLVAAYEDAKKGAKPAPKKRGRKPAPDTREAGDDDQGWGHPGDGE